MRNSMLLLGMSLLAAPLAAQQTSPSAAPSQASGATAPSTGAPKVTVGATVSDAQGGAVGTIASIDGANATVDTGTAKAAVPVTSFGQGQNGLVLGMTKAQLEAAVAKAKPQGTKVVGPEGAPVGTVSAVTDQLVTVQTPTTKVQLPKNAFAQNASGALAIGMTQAQLEAAAKSAGDKPS